MISVKCSEFSGERPFYTWNRTLQINPDGSSDETPDYPFLPLSTYVRVSGSPGLITSFQRQLGRLEPGLPTHSPYLLLKTIKNKKFKNMKKTKEWTSFLWNRYKINKMPFFGLIMNFYIHDSKPVRKSARSDTMIAFLVIWQSPWNLSETWVKS